MDNEAMKRKREADFKVFSVLYWTVLSAFVGLVAVGGIEDTYQVTRMYESRRVADGISESSKGKLRVTAYRAAIEFYGNLRPIKRSCEVPKPKDYDGHDLSESWIYCAENNDPKCKDLLLTADERSFKDLWFPEDRPIIERECDLYFENFSYPVRTSSFIGFGTLEQRMRDTFAVFDAAVAAGSEIYVFAAYNPHEGDLDHFRLTQLGGSYGHTEDKK